VCILDTQSGDQPDVETKSIFLTCGPKYIRIDLISLKGRRTVDVQEVLQADDWVNEEVYFLGLGAFLGSFAGLEWH